MARGVLLVLLVMAAMRPCQGELTGVNTVMEELIDGVVRFNAGNRVPNILAREQARLSERIYRTCNDSEIYRPYDGVCTNLENPEWGAPLQPLRRILKNAYDDGQGKPRTKGVDGNLLPSTREVSVACFPPDGRITEEEHFSQMIMQWGQFMDHDISGTPGTGATKCCDGMNEDGTHDDYYTGGPCMPIKIPENDRRFDTCMEFARSLPTHRLTEDCPREQINVLTSYLDSSHIYSSSYEDAMHLRNGTLGLMRTSERNNLPLTTEQKCIHKKVKTCYDGGDHRVNVFPGLTALHLLWVRDHNRIALALHEINPLWDDERLFQEARKIVVAENQHITMYDWLLKVLGQPAFDYFDLNPGHHYDPTLNPGVTNSFATAAFRFGHSHIRRFYGGLDIADMYFDNQYIDRSFEDVLCAILQEKGQKTDRSFSTGVTDELFANTSMPGKSLDLVAVNIQRGRDHGLPPYFDYFRYWSERIDDCDLFDGDLALPKCAIGLYDNIVDMDLFLGGLAERPIKGGMVGPTFAAIIAEQFYSLKYGDRFWYETSNQTLGFTPEQLAEIRNITLARVICDNSDLVVIQSDVMSVKSSSNKQVPCHTLPFMNLEMWRDPDAQDPNDP